MEMKKGIFYGVSVGPGDPELLTLKAVRILEQCPVLAVPQTREGQTLALDIAAGAVSLEGKTILRLPFIMDRDVEKQREGHLAAATVVAQQLAAGQDVAMPNLGDVSVYSTYCYLMELLQAQGYQTVMVPGVTSFCAVAARLGISLTSMNSMLHIVPAGGVPLADALELPGNKILMKSGKQLPQTVQALRDKGLLANSAMVQNCGLPDEVVCTDLTNLPEQLSYFATIIVKE